jgi:hypothetical protein
LNTTGVVKLLLAHGANPLSILKDMWIEYWKTPKAKSTGDPKELPPSREDSVLAELASALHLTPRYSLHRANKLKKPRKREVQIATGKKMTGLFRIPYHLVG